MDLLSWTYVYIEPCAGCCATAAALPAACCTGIYSYVTSYFPNYRCVFVVAAAAVVGYCIAAIRCDDCWPVVYIFR